MANQIGKSASSKPAKTPRIPVAAPTAASTAESKPKASLKPNSLLGNSVAPVTAQMRRAMIAEAAYYIAEQRGFGCGRDVDDWLRAERQIDATLAA